MHPKLLRFRAKLFRYREVERGLAAGIGGGRLLDIGCGDGENLLRFAGLPARRVGLEVSWQRLRQARRHRLDVLQATGERLPFADAAFDMIYVAHVLHHVADYASVLAEIERCLAPGGVFSLVETVTDHPLLRLARRIHPVWRGDAVEANWRYADLCQILAQAGWQIEHSDRYNLLFFLWEMLPLAFWPLEIFTPIFVYLDLLLARFLKQYSVHCYFALRKDAVEKSGEW